MLTFTKGTELGDGKEDQEVICLLCKKVWIASSQNPHITQNKTPYEDTHYNLGVEEWSWVDARSLLASQPSLHGLLLASERSCLKSKG